MYTTPACLPACACNVLQPWRALCASWHHAHTVRQPPHRPPPTRPSCTAALRWTSAAGRRQAGSGCSVQVLQCNECYSHATASTQQPWEASVPAYNDSFLHVGIVRRPEAHQAAAFVAPPPPPHVFCPHLHADDFRLCHLGPVRCGLQRTLVQLLLQNRQGQLGADSGTCEGRGWGGEGRAG